MPGKGSEQLCPSCGSTAVDTDTELAPAVCQDCGLVLSQELNTESFPSEVVENGNDGSPQTDENKTRSIDWQEEVVVSDASERQLVEVLSEMDSTASDLLIDPPIRLQAAEFITTAWERNLMHGRTKEITLGACLFAACDEANSPRPLRIVAEAIDAQPCNLFSTYRTIVSELGLQNDPTAPVEYLIYLQKATKVSDDVVTEAERLLNESSEIGGDPAGIAAGALYLAAVDTDLKITYVRAGQITGMTKETIWKKANAIREDAASINANQI
jgi:transcription initiation factor TFIIB